MSDKSNYSTEKLLEGLCVNYSQGLLAWVDILRKKIFLSQVKGSNTVEFLYPFTPSNIFEVNIQSALILDDLGLAEYFWEDNTLNRLFDFSDQLAQKGYRGNDGIKLSNDFFLFGSMHKQSPEDNPGAVWCLKNKKITKVAKNFIPNLFVNVGEHILIADSFKKIIYKHSAITGHMQDVWLDLSDSIGEPDGGCLSKDGYIYIANWGAAEMLKYGIDGKYYMAKRIDSLQPSNCKLYGNKLFVTTASVGMSAELLEAYPSSGKLIELGLF